MPFDGKGLGDPQRRREVELLERARSQIDTPRKWCKHRVSAKGRVCMAGAAMVAAGVQQWELRLWDPTILSGRVPQIARQVYFILSKYVPARFDGSVEAFNDHVETRHADVLDVFDRAIMDRCTVL